MRAERGVRSDCVGVPLVRDLGDVIVDSVTSFSFSESGAPLAVRERRGVRRRMPGERESLLLGVEGASDDSS